MKGTPGEVAVGANVLLFCFGECTAAEPFFSSEAVSVCSAGLLEGLAERQTCFSLGLRDC